MLLPRSVLPLLQLIDAADPRRFGAIDVRATSKISAMISS
jgi:hypothetical protein